MALTALTPSELSTLARIAKIRTAALATGNWEDLLHEAFVRALAGKRRWPRGVPFMAFLVQTMRSVASEWRSQDCQLRPLAIDREGEDVNLPTDHPGPDREVFARDKLRKLEKAFADDPSVLSVIAGAGIGETAEETAKRTGLTAAEFDAARKRFSRALPAVLLELGESS